MSQGRTLMSFCAERARQSGHAYYIYHTLRVQRKICNEQSQYGPRRLIKVIIPFLNSLQPRKHRRIDARGDFRCKTCWHNKKVKKSQVLLPVPWHRVLFDELHNLTVRRYVGCLTVVRAGCLQIGSHVCDCGIAHRSLSFALIHTHGDATSVGIYPRKTMHRRLLVMRGAYSGYVIYMQPATLRGHPRAERIAVERSGVWGSAGYGSLSYLAWRELGCGDVYPRIHIDRAVSQ